MTYIDLIPHTMLACHMEYAREMEVDGTSLISSTFYFDRMQAVADIGSEYREAIQATRVLRDIEADLDVYWPFTDELLSFLSYS